jgi:TRAP-type transport system periplasmic protein
LCENSIQLINGLIKKLINSYSVIRQALDDHTNEGICDGVGLRVTLGRDLAVMVDIFNFAANISTTTRGRNQMTRSTQGRAALRQKAAVLSGALLALGLLAAPGQAETMRLAVGQPDTHAHSYGYERYAAWLKANSGIDPKVFGPSLLALPEIPNGVRDGVAAMGSVITAYFAAEFAETNLVANLSMLSTSGEKVDLPAAAMSGAMMDYVLLNCPDCQKQYKGQNQVFLGSASTSPYSLLCANPVVTLGDMKGKKFRSGAANFGRWAEHVGGVKVSIPGNEIYDAMSQGVVDCAMLAVGDLIGASLADVTKAVHTGVPGGVFAGIAINNVNAGVWAKLPVADRAAVIKGTATLVADIVTRQRVLELEAIEKAKDLKIALTEADAETLDNYAAFVAGDLAVIANDFKTQYKLNDVDAKIAKVQELVEKWKGLTRDVGTDAAKLADIYWTEVLSKVDPATYGVN